MATYYVDSAAANDLGAGTTSETAWKTLALGAALNAGDQVYLNRGCVWREQLTVPAASLTLGAYGVGAKPVISGANVISTWTAYTGTAVNTYSADLATECKVVSIGGTAAAKGTGTDVLTDHQWIWSGNKLYFADATGDPDTSGVVITAGQRNYCISDNSKGAIVVTDLECREANTSFGGCIDVRGNGGVWTIQRCDLTGGAHSGLLMLNDDCVVEDCAITRNGTGVHMHQNSSGILFRRNDVSYNRYPGLNLYGCDTGIFEHNEIHHNGWNGIYIEGRVSQSVSADGNTIRYNDIYDNGQGPTWTDVTNGVEIYIAGGDNNVIVYNLIYVTASHTNDGGVHFDFGANGNLIAHNTIAGFRAGSLRGFGILIEDGTPGEGGPTINNTVENNIVANCRVLLGVANDIADDMQGNTFDYNCWYGGVDYAIWDGRPSSMTSRTLAQWQAASGQDAHSIGADPKLNAKYHLGNGSSAINAGVVIAGIGQVFSGAAPDIGAFEWQRKGNRGRWAIRGLV